MMNGFAHLNFIPLDYFYDFYDIYEQTSKRGDRKHIFSKLEQAKPYYDQWANLMMSNRSNKENRIEVGDVKTISEVRFYDEENAAYIKIDSFDSRGVESDYKRIREFYDKAVNYDNIIIDISDNGGGSTLYWKQNIVELLLNKTVSNPHYILYKLGKNNVEHLKDIYGEDFISTFKDIKELDINDIMAPEVVSRKFDAFIEVEGKYDPNPREGYYYKGKIWVLIDTPVYSSSDSFASFCKNTGFATLVGRPTGGDGLGVDPIETCLNAITSHN